MGDPPPPTQGIDFGMDPVPRLGVGGYMKPFPLPATIVAAALIACSSDPVSPGLTHLIGHWRPPTQPLQPQGTMDGLFIVRADAGIEDHVITRGLYPNQASDDLSAHEVLYGHIGIGEDKFVIHTDSLVTTDVFYGPTYRHVQRDFSGWPRDSTRYQILANELHLEYYSYPADAPVLTRRVLYRVP